MTLVYVDTSVVLAQLLVEPRRPAEAFWASHRLVSSQLLKYETLVRLRKRRQHLRERSQHLPDRGPTASDPCPNRPR